MRILVVEDQPEVLALAEAILKQGSHEIFTAATLARALEDLRSDEDFDLLFTDLDLGHSPIDGIRLALEAVRFRPGLRVIYTSGRPVTGETRELFVGGSRFIPKPYRSKQLLLEIDAPARGPDSGGTPECVAPPRGSFERH